jgi:hypothetical protein
VFSLCAPVGRATRLGLSDPMSHDQMAHRVLSAIRSLEGGQTLITRRKILAASAFAVASAVTPRFLAAEEPQTPKKFFKSAFNVLVNTRFSIANGFLDSSDLILMEITDGPYSSCAEQFSLLFKGSPARPLMEGLYDCSHPKLNRFQLHLQPVCSKSGGAYYRAAFNLLI